MSDMMHPPSGSFPPPPPGNYGGGYGGRPNYGPPPNNNLVWAIVTTVLCCLPFGIVSIVKAAEVNSKWAMGDVAGAYASAQAAKKWAIVSAVASVGVGALYLVFAVGMGAATYPSSM